MKVKIVSLVTLFALSIMTVEASTGQKEKFKVAGNCGMCETRIENAALSVDGVTSAEWDKKSEMIKVEYDSNKTESSNIQMAIVKAGHDTELHKADDKTYDKLPGCCKYEREAVKSSGCCPESKCE